MGLIDRLVEEWPVIAAAPYSFWLLMLAILVAAAGLAHLWNRREMSAIKAEKASADATTKLTEKERDVYKSEAENYKKDLEKANKLSGPSQLAPVSYGNTEVREAFVQVSSMPIGKITIYGTPSEWTDEDIGRFAAFTRLQEAGLAKIEQTTQPNASVVSGTSTAFEYANTPLPLRAATKKNV
ncbi:MAG TPA: hypothetical protein VN929_09205 [Burkholderiales bacterium]|nr:hypothetical protein [Burkholderiales bacterium]